MYVSQSFLEGHFAFFGAVSLNAGISAIMFGTFQ